MQVVDPGPRQLAATHAVHRWGITGAPFVRETRPVLLQPMTSAERLQLANDAGAPVHDGAEHVEGQGRGHHGSSTTFPSTPPSARHCNAALPSASRSRIAGCGRRPALTSWPTPNSNTDWEPGFRLTYSPYPTPTTLTLRSS